MPRLTGVLRAMIEEATIRELVVRLARSDRQGARVIERAAILAEGADSEEIVAWILSNGGAPESVAPALARGGLHGGRMNAGVRNDEAAPRRYVFPPGVLG